MKCAAVVPAAGLSSRMGSFKPLLELNGKSMIYRTLDSLRAGGIERIVVVTGHRAEELEEAVAAPDVRFVRNLKYAQTGMLESVQLGLQSLLTEAFDCVFILPGDIPLVRPETMQALKSAAEGGAQIARPSYQGKAGHPVLLGQKAANELFFYTGPDGLRGFLKGQLSENVFVETDDPGILADADTPLDLQKLNELQ